MPRDCCFRDDCVFTFQRAMPQWYALLHYVLLYEEFSRFNARGFMGRDIIAFSGDTSRYRRSA